MIRDLILNKSPQERDMELCYRNNPHSLFRKYSKLVTWFANTGIGRDYLGLPRSKFALMLPNGYSEWGGGRSFRSTFYTKPIYAPKLYPALQVVDLCHNWLKDFDEAKTLLAWQLGLTRRQPAIATNLLFATTSTFYPDPNPETTSVDGHLERSGVNETWGTIRAGAGTGAGDSDVNDVYAAQAHASATTNQYQTMRRGIFLHDSSAIPDTDTIDSGTWSGYANSTGTGLGQLNTALVASTPASNTALVSGDYSQLGGTRFATDRTINSTGAYWDFTLDANGLAAVSKTGVSKFGTLLANDLDNSAPTWASNAQSWVFFDPAEDAGGNFPKLVVVHSGAAIPNKIYQYNQAVNRSNTY